ncbi:hypothetical protein C8Q75DRAFT_778470 [Abortiporus biennis]|nr:hypothetical protein C8Q75DRAFT_778470 [Abortiporus biennis]
MTANIDNPLEGPPHTLAVPTVILSTTPPNDPPPPYPSRERRLRTPRTGRRRRTIGGELDPPYHQQYSSEHDFLTENHQFPSGEGGEDRDLLPPSPYESVAATTATETTPLLSSPRIIHGGISGRQRTLSITSTSAASIAPSLAQTVLSAFHIDRDSDLDACGDDEHEDNEDGEGSLDSPVTHLSIEDAETETFLGDASSPGSSSLRRRQLGSGAASRRSRWRKYFRPMGKRAYYSALFHLLLLNFPYALLAWVYLFVFTLAGTTTLMALPIGAVLCFVDLIGARIFARGELFLQTTFHGPLSYPLPYPPHPIFTRLRPPTPSEIESGVFSEEASLIYEKSFYRNAYAMFTDPTSYQSLFYFLVIKPGITVLLSLILIIIVPLGFVLVLPFPAVLRLVRRLGIWQGNVAVEGLVFRS